MSDRFGRVCNLHQGWARGLINRRRNTTLRQSGTQQLSSGGGNRINALVEPTVAYEDKLKSSRLGLCNNSQDHDHMNMGFLITPQVLQSMRSAAIELAGI